MKEQKLMVSVIIPVYNNGDYLNETLQSLEKQSYQEFEVIVVNDGSTDESESIIDEFVKKDRRFRKICQKNSGVSAARNAALETAKGRYVTFADGDDTLPADALKKMAETAQKTEADLIIGGIKRIDGFTEKINRRTENLKYKKEIKKDDLDLVHGLSLCNKWFLREIIEKHHLRLENFRHLEDGVFLYHFLQYGEKIHYCDAIVYEYWKRIPANGGSVTQRVEKGLLESAIGAYERLKQLTAGYSEAFQQELAYRINSTTFIGDYYKKLWSLDAESEKLLIEYTAGIWNMQSEEHKRRTIASHPGLELDRGLRTKEAMLKDPLFTILITPNVSETEINRILRSIYGQGIPSFCVMIDEKFYKCTETLFKEKDNLFFKSLTHKIAQWLIVAKSHESARHLIVIDKEVVFDYDTLTKVYECFQKKSCDVVKMHFIGEKDPLAMVNYAFHNRIFYGMKLSGNEDAHFVRKEILQKKCCFEREALVISVKEIDHVKQYTKQNYMQRLKKWGIREIKHVYRIAKQWRKSSF